MATYKPLNNRILGHGLFLILFILAIVYYIERTTYVDSAYALFFSIYDQAVIVRADRIAASLPQIFPLLGIWMHLPLAIVMMIWSVGFVVLYYIVYLVITHWFRKEVIALGVPLIMMLGINNSYFWISTETQQSMIYSVLLFGFLSFSSSMKPGFRNFLIQFIIGSFILFLCFFSHPVGVFPVLFILGFFMIDRWRWKNPELYILATIILIMVFIKILTVPAHGYEDSFFIDFYNSWKNIKNLGTSNGFNFFRGQILNLYLFPVIIFLSTVLFYAAGKQYLKMTYYLFTVLLFALILSTTFTAWVFPFLMEKNIMPLMIFILLPFLKDVVFLSPRLSLLKQVIIIAAFFLSVVNVMLSSSFIRERNNYILNILHKTRQFPEKKFIIDAKFVDIDRLNITWGIGPESLLLSSLKYPDSSRTVFLLWDYDTIAKASNLYDPGLFLSTPFYPEKLNINRFDKHYFNIENSVYRQLHEQDVFDKNSGGILYLSNFDDIGQKSMLSGMQDDGDNKKYFVMNPGYSPGYTGVLARISEKSSFFIRATVWVNALAPVDMKNISIVISHELDNEVKEYYMSGTEPFDLLKPNSWYKLEVTGHVHRISSNDVIKVYVWNRSDVKMLLNEMLITYYAN